MVDPGGKLLLFNSIRHAESHNKIVEEQLMWKLRRSDPVHSRREPNHRSSRRRSSSPDRRSSRRRSRSSSGQRRSTTNSAKDTRNFWLRKLAECKEADPDKWHHDGFKELYPEVLEKREPSVVTEAKIASRSFREVEKRHSKKRDRSRSRDKHKKSKKHKKSHKKHRRRSRSRS